MTTFTYTPAQEEWLQLLEKGDLPQAKFVLSCESGMCCLGVAAKLVLKGQAVKIDTDHEDYDTSDMHDDLDGLWYERIDGATQTLGRDQITALGLRSDSGNIDVHYPGVIDYMDEALGGVRGSLADMNDNGLTFQQIAAFIRKFPEAVFE